MKIETRGRKKADTLRSNAMLSTDVAMFLKTFGNKQGAFISETIKRTKAFREFKARGL